MEGTDRILRSRRQGGSRFISEEEEERLRRTVEERRKVVGRGRGYQGYARKDRAEEEGNGNTRKGSLHERQESTGEEEGSRRKSDRERTGGQGYGWRKNRNEKERRMEEERMREKEGAGENDREREEGGRGRENEVEGQEEMQVGTEDTTVAGEGGNEERNGRTEEEEDRCRSGERQEEEGSVGEKEDEVGRKLKDIRERIRKGMGAILERIGEKEVGLEEIKRITKEGMTGIMEVVEEVITGISYGRKQDEKKRRTEEVKSAARLDRIEERLKDSEDRLESMRQDSDRRRKKESVREMEDKIRHSNRQTKVMDLDMGGRLKDRREIVDKVLRTIREGTRQADRTEMDKILGKTRVIVLGKETESRTVSQKTIETAPILLECRTETDKKGIEDILKGAGIFPVHYWPTECLDFVRNVREEVRKMGYREEEYFIRIRPEEKDGRFEIRGDVKDKIGGSGFRKVATWDIPPADKGLWDRDTVKPR